MAARGAKRERAAGLASRVVGALVWRLRSVPPQRSGFNVAGQGESSAGPRRVGSIAGNLALAGTGSRRGEQAALFRFGSRGHDRPGGGSGGVEGRERHSAEACLAASSRKIDEGDSGGIGGGKSAPDYAAQIDTSNRDREEANAGVGKEKGQARGRVGY